MSKKALNAESPSFKSATLQQQAAKKPSFTPQTAGAAVFTPRGAGAVSPNPPPENDTAMFNAATAREFTPQAQAPGYDLPTNGTAGQDGTNPYDSFGMGAMGQALPNQQYNPYANDQSHLASQTGYGFSAQPQFSTSHQPLNYENYFPSRPKGQLQPHQRYMQDFFMDEELRLDVQRKAEAAHQMIVPTTIVVENYHSLMTLDTTGRETAGLFGHVTWVYKAISAKNGGTFCLRRLEGFRLSNEHAIKAVKDWKRIQNGNIVSTYDVFTTRAFTDSSLVFSQHYYPLAKTLMEVHFPSTPQNRFHRTNTHLSEQELWSYIVQISNALTAIHQANLAARCLDLSKIIITDKGVIQLSGCAILDVVHYERRRAIPELQQEDFVLFGRVILSLGTSTHPSQLNNLQASLDQLGRQYSPEMRDMVRWLIQPPQSNSLKTVDNLLSGISPHMMQSFDQSLQRREVLGSELFKEYCNGRVARLLMMLQCVNDREDGPNGDPKWSEHAERYQLKLFRDYVFHQVDEHGTPVIDMGHMLRCLYKLDAGSPEQIRLTSRDNTSDFIISYSQLKKMLGMAFGDLQKSSTRNNGGFQENPLHMRSKSDGFMIPSRNRAVPIVTPHPIAAHGIIGNGSGIIEDVPKQEPQYGHNPDPTWQSAIPPYSTPYMPNVHPPHYGPQGQWDNQPLAGTQVPHASMFQQSAIPPYLTPQMPIAHPPYYGPQAQWDNQPPSGTLVPSAHGSQHGRQNHGNPGFPHRRANRSSRWPGQHQEHQNQEPGA